MSNSIWFVTSIPPGFEADFGTKEEAYVTAKQQSKGDEKHVYVVNEVIQIEDWEDDGLRELWYNGVKYEPVFKTT